MRTCACSYCRRTAVPLRGNLVFFGFCSCERQLHDARDQRIMRSSRQKTHMNRGGVCPELAMRLRRIASPTWPLRGQSQRTRAKTGCISGRTHAIDPGKVTSDGDNYRTWAGGEGRAARGVMNAGGRFAADRARIPDEDALVTASRP